MTAADWIDDLERKAKAATPGPWRAKHSESLDWLSQERGDDTHQPGSSVHDGDPGNPLFGTLWPHRNGRADAEFIAAANPTTILRLIEDLRATRVCYTDECGEPCRSHVASLWAERDAARKAAGVVGERLSKERAKVAEVQAQRDRWKAAWEMASPLLTERDALAAKVAAVEALADETEQAGDPLLRLDRLRAALSAPTDTAKEN